MEFSSKNIEQDILLLNSVGCNHSNPRIKSLSMLPRSLPSCLRHNASHGDDRWGVLDRVRRMVPLGQGRSISHRVCPNTNQEKHDISSFNSKRACGLERLDGHEYLRRRQAETLLEEGLTCDEEPPKWYQWWWTLHSPQGWRPEAAQRSEGKRASASLRLHIRPKPFTVGCPEPCTLLGSNCRTLQVSISLTHKSPPFH